MGVVGLTPVVDDDDSFGEAAELLDVEQLVADAAVEGFHVGILPGRAWLDERRFSTAEATPVPERVGGQLRPVVATDMRGRATHEDELVEHGDGLVCADAP